MSSEDQNSIVVPVLIELCRIASALVTLCGALLLSSFLPMMLALTQLHSYGTGSLMVGLVAVALFLGLAWASFRLMKYQYRAMERAPIYWHLLLIAVVIGVPLSINMSNSA